MNRFITVCLLLVACVGIAGAAQDPNAPPPPVLAPAPIPPVGPGIGLTSRYKELIPALTEALKDKDKDVRLAACAALSSLGQEAVKPLIEALKNDDKAVQAAAIEALGKLGAQASDAVPALIKALKDEDKEVRKQSAIALGAIARSPYGMMFVPPAPIAVPPIPPPPIAPAPVDPLKGADPKPPERK